MDTREKLALRGLILSLDGVLILLAMGLAVWVHPFLRELTPLVRAMPSFATVSRLGVLVLPLWLLLIILLRLDRTYERAWSTWELLVGLIKLSLIGLLALSAILFATQIVINRSLILTFLTSSFVLLFVERSLLGRWQGYQRAQGRVPDRLLLCGDVTHDLLRFVRQTSTLAYPPTLVGRIGAGADELPDLPERLGEVDALATVLRDKPIDAVVFFPPYHSPSRADAELAMCETLGVPAHFAIDLGRPNQAEPRVISLFELPCVTYEIAPKSPARLAIKHGLDVLLACLAIVVAIPLLILVALAITVTMGRPILFGQERAGLRGRRFTMYKFRTMVRHAESRRDDLGAQNEMGGPVFKLARDPRVTRFGHLLRRSSIDELPQLFNVLTGSMSLVGPRPLPVKEQQQISGWHRRRLMMKPGLTCLWQVKGRNRLSFETWMALDLQYVDTWSLGLDARILLLTIPAVLFGRGAR